MIINYRCIDSAGRKVKGSITADGPEEAKALLKERGLTVLEISEARLAKSWTLPFVRQRITDSDLYNMAREMTILLKSGVKLDKALEVLGSSMLNQKLRGLLAVVLSDVRGGKRLSLAFADTGEFSKLITTIIAMGEKSGNLRASFENIAEHTKFQMELRSEIRNAMAYPIFLIIASFVTLFVILKFIVPKFFGIFGENSWDSLPLPARFLFSVSNFITAQNLFYTLVVLAGVVFFVRLPRIKAALSNAYAYLVYVPIINRLLTDLELSRFSYSMYSTLESGLEFINALNFSTSVIQQKIIREAVESTEKPIREGRSIADVFSQISFLPEIVPNMLRVGEESGNLKEIFRELYYVFNERFKNSVKRMLVLFEPMVITVTGFVVGFIVISLILTVMSVGNISF